MPLDRPLRPPAGAVTDRVRRAILAEAHRRGLQAPAVLAFHAEADHLGDIRDVVADLEERYQLAPGSFIERVGRRMYGFDFSSQFQAQVVEQKLFSDAGAGALLLELPETEFLTVIEPALEVSFGNGRIHPQQVVDLYEYVSQALCTHGTPYRAAEDGRWSFEWVGDPEQHKLSVQPALLALGDQRLAGARAEFDEALHRRRSGTPKDLEAAVAEAAKSVESALKVLHDERSVTRPRSEQLTRLFDSLVAARVLPGYVDKLVAGAAGPRNHMAGHGQGGAVREVPQELAEASIAAAATAITFLAHYLP